MPEFTGVSVGAFGKSTFVLYHFACGAFVRSKGMSSVFSHITALNVAGIGTAGITVYCVLANGLVQPSTVCVAKYWRLMFLLAVMLVCPSNCGKRSAEFCAEYHRIVAAGLSADANGGKVASIVGSLSYEQICVLLIVSAGAAGISFILYVVEFSSLAQPSTVWVA